jgi:hypothetical protein
MTLSARQLDTLVNFEAWAERRLDVHLFKGDTTPDVRRERLRRVILDRGLAATAVTAKKGAESWGQIFERMYGLRLDQQHEAGDGI